MSYIKVMLGGKDRGLKFNLGSVFVFNNEMAGQDKSFAIYATVWAGLKSNAFAKREEFVEDFETVCDWCDQLNMEQVLEITNCFNSIETFRKDLPKEDDKKKLNPEITDANVTKLPGD